jgi:hypothetical protein
MSKLILHDFQIYDKIDDRTPCQKLAINKNGEILAAYYKPHPFAGPPYWSFIKQGETFEEINRPRLNGKKESKYYSEVLKEERKSGATKERINFLISLIELSLKWENRKEDKPRTNKLTKIFNY